MRYVIIVIAILALCLGFGLAVFGIDAASGLAFIGIACFLAVCARIAQASDYQHQR